MSDKIEFLCSFCNTQLAVSVQYAGQQAKCPGCGAVVDVPSVDLEETAPYFPSSTLGRNELGSEQDFSRGEPQPSAAEPATAYEYPASLESTPAPKSSFGASLLGLMAAIFVGGVCAIAWLAIIIIFQVELGILAWGIGALIGLVAGSIAKNGSAIYCFMVACIAGCSILASKLIMVAFIMIASLGMNAFENFQNLVISNKYEHAYVDQQLADNQYNAEKTRIAESFNKDYFEQSNRPNLVINGREIGGFNANPETWTREMADFRNEVRNAVGAATVEQKKLWIDNARQRHPDWIFDPAYATAAKILLLNAPDQLEGELRKHAEYEIAASDYLLKSVNTSDSYLTSTPDDVFKLRSDTLRELVLAIWKQRDSQGLDALLREAVTLDPTFIPDETSFVVIVDELLANGDLPANLQEHATNRIEFVTKNAMAFKLFENLATEAFGRDEIELRSIANPIWLASTGEQQEERVAQTKIRHPGWNSEPLGPQWVPPDELKEELGDGSFIGSVQKVFAVTDLLWLALGFISAFGTARSRAASV
ncbi:hypothetical protein SH449x_003208 [Pirellulaceae bacterium SH449]